MLLITQIPRNIQEEKIDCILDKICFLNNSITSVVFNKSEYTIDITFTDNNAEEDLEFKIKQLYKDISKLKIRKNNILRENIRDIKEKTDYKRQMKSYYTKIDIAILELLDHFFLKMALNSGAKLREYPSTMDYSSLERNQYHKNFPQNIYPIFEVPHDYEILNNIRNNKVPLISNDQLISSCKILQPCICYHVYDELSDQQQYEMQIYTAKGKCFRNESIWKLDQFRKTEFNMREIVILGPPQEVKKIRDQLLNKVWDFFIDIGLNGKIETANDPFFSNEDLNKVAYQLMSNAKYELLYQRKNNDFSAIASFNYCNDHLCRAYNIKHVDKYFHSGCVAFGLDRWLEAIKESYGEDINLWPSTLKKYLKKSEGGL